MPRDVKARLALDSAGPSCKVCEHEKGKSLGQRLQRSKKGHLFIH